MKNNVLFGLILLVVLNACNQNKPSVSDPSLYLNYITDYSSGLLSSESDIRIVMPAEKVNWSAQEVLSNKLFSIEPKVKGKVVALSNNTLAFVPEEGLKNGTDYLVTFHLSKVTEVPEDLRNFTFLVKTIEQNFMVQINDLQSINDQYQYINGVVNTSDVMPWDELEQLVSAEHQKKSVKIKFNKTLHTKNSYPFVIDSILRTDKDTKLKISWDGKSSNINQKGGLDFDIFGRNHFGVISAGLSEEVDKTLLINFSDPLLLTQNYEGLVSLGDITDLRFSTSGNLLKVFFEQATDGNKLLEVFSGIQNAKGQKLDKNFTKSISFTQHKPGIKLLKNGTILPSSNHFQVNFEAVNLRAVEVKVYQIFENNVLQFLQDNDLISTANLKKVAQPVAKKTFTLQSHKMQNMSQWKAYAIDLAKLVSAEPGAIYRVELSYNQSHSLYKCGSTFKEDDANQTDEAEDDDYNVKASTGYFYDNDYDYSEYNWYEREDPCKPSYYFDNKIRTNVLATDLGVIAKASDNGSYHFAVSNLVTTEPVSGASIKLYSFQQQLQATIKTDKDGLASITTERYPYFAVVSKDNNVTYLKLDDNRALSVSEFEVDGQKLQKGLKGYIYGERGVWRPGDTLFISFILNDKESKLQKNHPIKLRLADPTGKIKYEALKQHTLGNHYTFVMPTHPEDKTGSWEARVSVGNVHFYKSIRIETIKPNRLKIKNNLADAQLSLSKPNKANFAVEWLHGAVGKQLKIEVAAKIKSTKTTFKNYKNFVFDDATKYFETNNLILYQGITDDDGQAVFDVNPKLSNQSPGLLSMVLETKVFESGGDFSTDATNVQLSPYTSYVGIKKPETNRYGALAVGKDIRFDLQTVNEKGVPVGIGNLEVNVYRLDWNWWWNANEDDLSRYQNASSLEFYRNFKISSNAQGKAALVLNINEEDWGNYLIKVYNPSSGHVCSTAFYADYDGYNRNDNQGGNNAQMLKFKSDKDTYNVGEKAELRFPSSEDGRALISVENGSKVLSSFWVKTTKGETKTQIALTPDMAPNIYVNITLLRPHQSKITQAPLRMYGILNLNVVDLNSILQPQITAAEVWRPEQKIPIKVSEKNGQAMTYTLAIVEDGLLDLTRFKTPNAWENFFSKQSLGVKTWDVYNEVVGAYGGMINQVFSIGGDLELAGSNAKKANRFKPIVMHLGPFTLDKGKTHTHQVKLPNYVGSVRTMVVAANNDKGAYGAAEKSASVRNPLMVLGSIPRKLSSGEKITIPVAVFAMENQIKNVEVSLKTGSLLKVVGSSKQTLSFSQPDEKNAYFELEVGNKLGLTTIEIEAVSGKEKAKYALEIDVTNPNPAMTQYKDVVIAEGKTQTISFDAFGIPGSQKATIELSGAPTVNFEGRMQYLIQYPHGCLEQTISAAFPQLYLAEVVEVNDAQKSNIQKNVQFAIGKIVNHQIANGGFAYWSGQSYADDWVSSYAGHFLIEADKKGYVIPQNTLSNWLKYQKSEAKKWRYQPQYANDLPQAYRLYTLALHNSPEMGAMNRMKEVSNISAESKLRLATAYALVKQTKIAQKMIAETPLNTPYFYHNYYGSEDRNRAMLLDTYLETNQNTKAFQVAEKMAKALSSNKYFNTQATAYSLYAMSKFLKTNAKNGIEASYLSNSKTFTVSTKKSVFKENLGLSKTNNNLKITNKSKGSLYARVSYSGILPVGEEQVFASNLEVDFKLLDAKGLVSDQDSFKQGTQIVAKITIKNTSSERVSNVALTHIIPSGFEFININLLEENFSTSNEYDYKDIRDDRGHYYFDLKAGETKQFQMKMNATYLGNYYYPGIFVEAMYDDLYGARTRGKWINIGR